MPEGEPTRLGPAAGLPITSWDFGGDTDTSAPVALAVHDFTANGLWFGDLADGGSGRFRLVAPDLRGRAASVAAPAAATLADHIADVVGLADHIGAATFAVVGHGTGAVVALATAAAAPTRVTRVVLIDGPPVLSERPEIDWTTAAALVDPGITRVRRTWAHRDSAIAEGVASGRLPASGMTRRLRRAVDAEITGSGFGWRPRLAPATLEQDWKLLSAWTPPADTRAAVWSIGATHGHRRDDPPVRSRGPGVVAPSLDTTHTGLLVEPSALRAIAAAIADPPTLG